VKKSDEHDDLVLTPRDVRFDWESLPLHRVPGEPLTTHVINVLHLLLPEGERWFVEVFRRTTPLITGEELRSGVLGFTGQEAVHAEAHQGVLDHLIAKGVPITPYVDQVEYLFRQVLGDKPGLDARRERQYLVERVAIIAGIEHFTAFLGDCILNAAALDRAGADPTMLDLLRWHGAEEVEHRAVAYDPLRHLDRGYVRRIRTMVVATTTPARLWIRGTRYLASVDPGRVPGTKASRRGVLRAARRGLLPDPVKLTVSVLRYFAPARAEAGAGAPALTAAAAGAVGR
jgi:predicted metal-dependent hydrolase